MYSELTAARLRYGVDGGGLAASEGLLPENSGADVFAVKIGRCRVRVSNTVLKAPMVSALEATI